MDKEFIENIERFARNSIFNDDVNIRRKFFRSLTHFFLNNYKVEWFNVLSILSTNIDATYVNTVEKWNLIVLENNQLEIKIVPKAGTKASKVYIPNLNGSKLKWQKINVFDVKQMVNLHDYNIIPSIKIADECGGDIVDIEYYINVLLSPDLFFNNYVKIQKDILKKYSFEELNYIKEIVFYSLTGVCRFNNQFEFNSKKLSNDLDILIFIHDIYILIHSLPKYFLNELTRVKNIVYEEEKKEMIIQRSSRNLKQRINDAKILAIMEGN